MKDIAEDLLSKVEKQYNGDIFTSNRNESCYIFEKNNIISQEKIQSDQVALRIVGDNNIGYSTGSGEYDSDKMLKNALETYKYNTEQCKLGEYAHYLKKSKVQIYDLGVTKIDYLFIQSVKEKLMELLPAISRFQCQIQCIVDDISYYRFFAEKKGYDYSYKKTILKVQFEAYSENNDLLLYYRNGKCKLFDFVNDITAKVYLRQGLPYYQVREMKIRNVFFSPLAVYCITKNYLGMSLNGKLTMKQLNSSLFSRNVNIIDCGIIDWQIGSQPFDDDGIMCKTTKLVHEGKINEFYSDILTAQKRKTLSSGNGKRGWCTPSSPFYNNLIISSSLEAQNLLSDISEGYYIDYLEDNGTSDNINGIFRGKVVIGYLTKNGKYIERISNCSLQINIDEMLQKAQFVNPGEWIAGDFYSPTIFLTEISLTEV
ncbi:MAG: hypothetical protein LBS02_02160 [Hungatella sp.]|jgi:PmbA protein|nr:hypothetical protein [Hungatella sp.]